MNDATSIPCGPVVIDIAGTTLSADDRTRLLHRLVGGVILFARNYESPEALIALTSSIHALRDPPLLIAVDHEGGRVQRFRLGFTTIPPMRTLGELWHDDAAAANVEAARIGKLIATELRAHGIDFSFTPVLDLDHGSSTVIGDRAFDRDPEIVAELAQALVSGLRAGGCAGVGKHFPGHGFVTADSHVDVPVDPRSQNDIEEDDAVPFATLINAGLEAIMPAHVIYPSVDSEPAGFSSVWLQKILRNRLAFDGVVFSDDLAMAGAHGAGDIVARADAATAAGCDMVLLCNDSAGVDVLLNRWDPPENAELARRVAAMRGR